MSPALSGGLLMIFGAFLIGGAWSFRQQKLPVAVQVVMAVLGLAVFAYGGYVMFTYA